MESEDRGLGTEDRPVGALGAEDRSVGGLLSDLANGLATLVRQELRLAQAEGSEKISNAVIGVAAILGGLLIAACSLLILLQALVIALAHHMPDWLAASPSPSSPSSPSGRGAAIFRWRSSRRGARCVPFARAPKW